jgi:hypothetical protein
MPYGVVWKPTAEQDLDAIAAKYPVQASQILDHIDRLAEDPAALARKPSFPHPLYPKYQFWIEHADESHNIYVTVLFNYEPGGKDIAIHFIGWQLVPKDYPLGP